jgi:dihydrofolate reductase
MPLVDTEVITFVEQVYQRADAFLFGRWTFELFADYWGVMEAGSHPIADALNSRPKYVASTTLTDPQWADTTVLSGDVAAAIRDLKAKPRGELQLHGSGVLTRWLLDNDLVDEMNLLIVPVVVGQGTRLFLDNGPDLALALLDSRAFPTGTTLETCRPNGRPQYADGAFPLRASVWRRSSHPATIGRTLAARPRHPVFGVGSSMSGTRIEPPSKSAARMAA